MDLSNKKREARIQYRQARKKNIQLTEKDILIQVEKLLKNLSDKTCCRNFVGIYWPLEDEVDLRSLKKKSRLPLALPASNERGEISYHKLTNSVLKKDAYGIPSPLEETTLKPNQIRLLIVPALAIDHNGTRLGYGGGCFDRLR